MSINIQIGALILIVSPVWRSCSSEVCNYAYGGLCTARSPI